MKLLIQLTLFITCCAGEVPALAQDTLYYNSAWKETTADKASYFRIKVRSAIGWKVTDYFLLGKPQMKGEYADDSFHVRQGEFAWFL